MPPVSPHRFCTSCGKPLQPEAKFCIYCRAPVREPATALSAQNPTPAPASKPGVPCPNCGYINTVDSNFCIMCRTALSNKGINFASNSGTTIADSDSMQYVQRPQKSKTDDDDLSVRPLLVTITREEARNGCTKQVDTKGYGIIDVRIPAGTNPSTKIDIPGMGFDDGHGRLGPLRLSFYIY